MLHGTRRYGLRPLSFERPEDRKNPERKMARRMRSTRPAMLELWCDLCGANGHSAARCCVIVDSPREKPEPSGPLGVIHAREVQRPVPLEEYRGPGRVIVLPIGVHGDQAGPYLGDESRSRSKENNGGQSMWRQFKVGRGFASRRPRAQGKVGAQRESVAGGGSPIPSPAVRRKRST